MKRILILLLFIFMFVSCGKEQNNSVQTNSEAIYMDYSFEDTVHLSDVVVLAEYVNCEENSDNTEFLFKIIDVLCGDMPEDDFYLLTFNGTGYIPEKNYTFTTGTKKYKEGGKYILVLDRDSSIFYDHDRFQEFGDVIMDVEENNYMFNGEKLKYTTKNEAVEDVMKLYNEVTHEEYKTDHKYDSEIEKMKAEADIIAVVDVVSDGVKAKTHNGVRYECEVKKVLKGEEPYSEEGKILLVLEADKVSKGHTYIIGFNPADRDSEGILYVQCALNTIMEDSVENRKMVCAQ